MDSVDGAGNAAVVLDLPHEVEEVVRGVQRSGSPVFAVGGVVRDALLGIAIDDWDFATAVRPDVLAATLGAYGEPHTVARLGRVAVDVAGFEVVFTTFREEADYGPDRRPGTVRFVDSPEQDAVRRDFTTNAVYVEIGSGAVTDPTGGLGDLRARRLRTIGDPRVRFAEDPLRILRGVRFESSRGLRPTATTAAAMAEMAPRCARLTAERRFGELHRALVEPGAAGAVLRLLDLGVLGHVLPELRGDEPRVREEAVPLLAQCDGDPDGASAWAALLGAPEVAQRALGELHAPRRLRRRVVGLLAFAAEWEGDPAAVPLSRRRRDVAEAPAGAAGFVARRLRCRGEVDRAARVLALARSAEEAEPPLPSGKDVIALGVPPGPLVGQVLDAVRRSVDAEGLTDPEAVRRVLEREVERRVKARPEGDR